MTPSTDPAGPVTAPIQPHSYPYLVDKFFYTGASTFLYPAAGAAEDSTTGTLAALARGPGATDPSQRVGLGHSVNIAAPVVGGPASDGWFKMLEFFEVPSQMNGSIGTVAGGMNFDWARQDTKPGLMNLNLIIDEEAFFAVFGRQTIIGL